MEKMNTVQPLFPFLPERLAGLEELAENLWWSWNPGARMLFKTLDRQAWKESGHNPDKMLRNRVITARLYIGDFEQRLRQEIVLGLGGAEVLKTLGIDHYLLHLNEGHAAFALLERIRATVTAGKDFAAACEKNINTTIFTTHTPVPAGHDVFPFLFQKYGRGFERLAW